MSKKKHRVLQPPVPLCLFLQWSLLLVQLRRLWLQPHQTKRPLKTNGTRSGWVLSCQRGSCARPLHLRQIPWTIQWSLSGRVCTPRSIPRSSAILLSARSCSRRREPTTRTRTRATFKSTCHSRKRHAVVCRQRPARSLRAMLPRLTTRKSRRRTTTKMLRAPALRPSVAKSRRGAQGGWQVGKVQGVERIWMFRHNLRIWGIPRKRRRRSP
mmetsp:Transcript_49682/g.80164  ORF Transcript_49682/g.80164 Transcript_49682/m.80164 type:complete len:212 (+) Transcript_49682:694-1329(+)